MAQFSKVALLSPRYQLALTKAFEWHCYFEKGFQTRKDGSPYIAHPIAVSTLVLENGGSEDEAIIALLHDVVEDVKILPDTIAEYFGLAIADVVIELSEPKEGEWQERKLVYINQIRNGSNSAVLVSLADKYHNATAYLKGAREGAKDGSQKSPERTLWFLGELSKVYADRLPDCYLVKALKLCLAELTLLWSGDSAHIVGGEFYSRACDWEREFSEPDYPEYPEYCCYPDDFSRPYWLAVRDKDFWFEASNPEQHPIEFAQPIELLQDINIRYYESGEIFANVPVNMSGQECVIEVWGKSAEWLSSYAQKGTKALIDILKTDVVEGITVIQGQIKDSLLAEV